MVKSNEVIAEIDPSTYKAAVEQATADLANAKANLELQQVEANRSAELFTNKLISGSDYDTAIANLHEAQAMVQIKQASLGNATANLGYCKIRSPVDGMVISRSVDLGQTVASSFNTPTLFQIANDLTKMQIDSSVAEADIGGVVEGQSVDFTVDAYPYRTFQGVVTQVRNSPTTVNNVVTYDCVIGVTNADYKLKPGMTANVSIIVAQRKNALNIPNSALRFVRRRHAVVDDQRLLHHQCQATNRRKWRQLAVARGRCGWRGTDGEHRHVHTVYMLLTIEARIQIESRGNQNRHHGQYQHRSAVRIEGRRPGGHRPGDSRLNSSRRDAKSLWYAPAFLSVRRISRHEFRHQFGRHPQDLPYRRGGRVMPSKASHCKSCPANLSPSWVPAAPANPP